LAAIGDLLFRDGAFCPIVIGAVGDDEFDFVLLGEVPEVSVMIFLNFVAAGAFQVHDFDNARINRRNIQRTTGFE